MTGFCIFRREAWGMRQGSIELRRRHKKPVAFFMLQAYLREDY
jgi:hypothetical protein